MDLSKIVSLILNKQYPYPFGCTAYTDQAVIFHTLKFYGFSCRKGFVYLANNSEMVVISKDDIF